MAADAATTKHPHESCVGRASAGLGWSQGLWLPQRKVCFQVSQTEGCSEGPGEIGRHGARGASVPMANPAHGVWCPPKPGGLLKRSGRGAAGESRGMTDMRFCSDAADLGITMSQSLDQHRSGSVPEFLPAESPPAWVRVLVSESETAACDSSEGLRGAAWGKVGGHGLRTEPVAMASPPHAV